MSTADAPAARVGAERRLRHLQRREKHRALVRAHTLTPKAKVGSIPTSATGSETKDRLVPSLRCKRSPYGQEVRFHPLPTNFADSMAALVAAIPVLVRTRARKANLVKASR